MVSLQTLFCVFQFFRGGLQLGLRVPPSPKRVINFGNLPMLNHPPANQFNHWLMAGGEAQHASLPEV